MDPASLGVPAPAPGLRRPLGVVLAAIVLGLITLFWIFGGLTSIFGGVFVRTPQVAQYPALEGMQFGAGILILLLSGLCASVVVGLFQLKNWARIGILIVGGVVAFYSLVMAAIFSVMAFINLDAFTRPGSPSVSPVAMKAVLLAMAGVSFLFVLVGVWWLVYFNLRRVRALFVTSRVGLPRGVANQAPTTVDVISVDSAPPKRSVVEVLLICLAVLYFWGAVSGIFSAFLRFPFFMFGHIFRGAFAAVLMLALAVSNFWVGIGLLRRVKAAWIGALALNTLTLLYALTMVIPGPRASLMNYQDDIGRHMQFGPPPNPALNHLLAGPIYAVTAVMIVLMAGAIFWLLLKAKPLFEAKAT